MTQHLTNITLTIWRQNGPADAGHFETFKIDSISDEASFLELMDVLNERLITEGKEAIVFDSDCREGCLLYTSPSPRDRTRSRMPSSA